MPKAKVNPYQKQDGTAVRGHLREVPGKQAPHDELPPEQYDVTATVEATADREGNLSTPEVTKVELKPRRREDEQEG